LISTTFGTQFQVSVMTMMYYQNLHTLKWRPEMVEYQVSAAEL